MDSKWIGDLFRLGFVPESFIPCKEIRILREYTRCRQVYADILQKQRKKRSQNTFTVCNVAS